VIDWDTLVIGPTVKVFGEPFTYLSQTFAPFDFTGVYDEAYREVDLAGGMGVTTTQPVVGIQLSQFPITPAQDDLLTCHRTSETFKVREARPDGHGWMKLHLNLNA
jgi:hypothetical protein